jgi:hypothetical protein
VYFVSIRNRTTFTFWSTACFSQSAILQPALLQ